MIVGGNDPRQFGTSSPERVQIALRDASQLARGNGPQNVERWESASLATGWTDPAGLQVPEYAAYPDLSRLRGIAEWAAAASTFGAGALRDVLTVPDPPADVEIFERVAYLPGAGYVMVGLVLDPSGLLQLGDALIAPSVALALPTNSWVNLAGIAWQRETG